MGPLSPKGVPDNLNFRVSPPNNTYSDSRCVHAYRIGHAYRAYLLVSKKHACDVLKTLLSNFPGNMGGFFTCCTNLSIKCNRRIV